MFFSLTDLLSVKYLIGIELRMRRKLQNMRDNECFTKKHHACFDVHVIRGSFVTLRYYEFCRFIPILFASIFWAFPCCSVDIDAATYLG